MMGLQVTWDGHTSSVEAATRAARANITLEEQIHQIHKVKGLLPDEEKEKIGPKPVGSRPAASMQALPPPPGTKSAVPLPMTSANKPPSVPISKPQAPPPAVQAKPQPIPPPVPVTAPPQQPAPPPPPPAPMALPPMAALPPPPGLLPPQPGMMMMPMRQPPLMGKKRNQEKYALHACHLKAGIS